MGGLSSLFGGDQKGEALCMVNKKLWSNDKEKILPMWEN